MREYIIKIWEDEECREEGISDVVGIGLTDMKDTIEKAKHIMALHNYASLEVQTQDEKTTVFAITPEDSEQYFNEEIAKIELQDKINKYFKLIYPGNVLQSSDAEIFGKVKDVIKELKENQEFTNAPENESDEEWVEFINTETKELIEDLENINEEDIVRLQESPMSGFFTTSDMADVLKELQESYLKHMKDFNITHKNISNIVETYLDINEITNLMEYGADSDIDTMESQSDLFKEILKELDIPVANIFTRDGHGDGRYDVIVLFEKEKEYSFDTKAWHTVTEITKEIEENIESNELEKIAGNEILYKGIKALTKKQKGVLSSLAKNNNNLSKVSRELNIDRKTARKLRDSAISIISEFFNKKGGI